MDRSPLYKDEQISTASADDLKEQLRWELEVVFDSRYSTNEQMATDLVITPSSVSKWRTGSNVLSKSAARRLDDLGYKPSLGESFVALREA